MKHEYELMVNIREGKIEFAKSFSFSLAFMNARAQAKLAKFYRYWIKWRIVRSDGVVIAQSK